MDRFRRTECGRRLVLWTVILAFSPVTQSVSFSQVAQGPAGVEQLGNSSITFATPAAQALSEARAYWTPQRLLNAKPMAIHPAVGSNGFSVAPPSVRDDAPAVRGEGSPPTMTLTAHELETIIPPSWLNREPATQASDAQPQEDVVPNDVGTLGAHFTGYKLFPDAAYTVGPNTRHGKLFFSDPRTGADYTCSASTLRPRLVVTAGHCVFHASAILNDRYWYHKFFYIPAFHNGIGSIWTQKAVWVTKTWSQSPGTVPNAQDVAILIMNDNNGKRIGEVTGWNGYWTNQIPKNHLTMFGYPGNLDGGQLMEVNHAGTFDSGGNNTWRYGSAMSRGASGGAWIMDYGVSQNGNPKAGKNYLVSVTSYGPANTAEKYIGGSNLDSRFIDLLNSACGSASSGNCQ